ncbi:hypothetical protein [Candidatus Poriferisocius sp.]|uniref:hypothetical protein n=1 Tax=Candidatus Poriferisocius sp. TaxID=3101276 RepID=UPI003B521171
MSPSWRIDWADDGYQHPAAAIPAGHLVSWRARWGSDLSPGAPNVGIATTDLGHLVLMSTTGRYWRSGTLTRDQLRKPHAYQMLDSTGSVRRTGRCFPALTVQGADVQPRTWMLEGPDTRTLLANGTLDNEAGSMASIIDAIVEASGIPIRTNALQTFTGLTYSGSWSALLSILSTFVGGWATETGIGQVRILTPGDIEERSPIAEVTSAWGLTRERTGIAEAYGLVRTHVAYHAADLPRAPAGGVTAALGGSVSNEALVAAYGRRVLKLPDWFSPGDLAMVFAQLRRLIVAPTFVTFEVADTPASERIDSGDVIVAEIPGPEGTTAYSMAVLSTEIHGDMTTETRRLITGLSLTDAAGNLPGGDNSSDPNPVYPSGPAAPTLKLLANHDVQVILPAGINTNVDIQRAPSGERSGDDVKIIATDHAHGTAYTDTPGPGTWDYRLRRPTGASGLWGRWATITVPPVATIPAPTLTLIGQPDTIPPPSLNLIPADETVT